VLQGTLDPHGAFVEVEMQVSSVAQRDQLEGALEYVREGDASVTKLDRLAKASRISSQLASA
jgi:DNA invertase Pin-like site-specific DNA recombinase